MKCIYLCVRLIVLFLVSVPNISQQQNNPTGPEPAKACKEACGLNTKCLVVKHNIPYCSCKPGFKGDPWTECVPRAGPSRCAGQEECPTSQACIQGKCTNPCEGLCGGNTSCTILSHVPTCACKKDFSGNPFSGCSRIESCSTLDENVLLTQGKKRFYLSSEVTNWMKALAGCARNNSRLACVESMEEIKEIDELTKHHAAWTSGTDQGNKFNFFWASTGKPLPTNSELWIKLPIQQPDNYGGDEDCVVFQASLYDDSIYNPGLNDRPCDDEQIYVCEYYE